MTGPLIVVEASQAAFEHAVREIERDGRRVVEGWHSRGPSHVCTGAVRDAGEAAEALLAAVGGSGLVVHALAEREVVDRLVDDLRRLGPADHRTGEPDMGPGLTVDERRLLDRLSDGKTLGEAAAELHLSRRTADRRLAAARQKLGVATTAEAVVAHARSS